MRTGKLARNIAPRGSPNAHRGLQSRRSIDLLNERVDLNRSGTETSPELGGEQAYLRLALPNGLTFYTADSAVLGAAEFLIKEIFHRNRYHHEGFAIRPNDTVVDVGANMGLFVLWAAPQASEGRVIAIEPTDVLNCLELNIKRNALRNVQTLQTAVGKDEQPIVLVEHPGFNIVTHRLGAGPTMATRFLIRLLYGKYHRCTVRTTVLCAPLPHLLEKCQVDVVNYLKMDCEGGEYEILRAMRLAGFERIERIALEFHELSRDQRHQELVSILKRVGFQVEVRRPLIDYYLMRFGEIWAWRP